MKMTRILLIAGAVILSPAAVLAGPGGHGGGGRQGAAMGRGGMSQSGMSQPTTHTEQGSTHGSGWDHQNAPRHATGQAFFECGDTRPGHASTAPGSAFNEDGKAGTKYAGEQPQNSRNSSSVSQYDTACMHQPQH